jgi:hypothetical protein
MSGGGLYSLATVGARHVIDAATPMVVDAINSLPQESIVNGFTLSDMGTADAGTSLSMNGFTLSDMGTADAGTSLSMIECSIEAVKARVPEAPVSIVYSDQPRNDFNALIANVYGLGPFDTYLDKHSNVFPLVSGTTFYKQIVPAASLDIGFSATAMHWMSSKVCNITNHVQAIGAEGEELEAFRAQAHRDWRQILLHRATELKPGGKLILTTCSIPSTRSGWIFSSRAASTVTSTKT